MVSTEKGSISIHTENIFPIIKKFLYSDHEIFLRELVSNSLDAIQKLKRLGASGEFNGEFGEPTVKVTFDKEAKTITVSDNGLGMSAEEIKKYINQIAFSGASEFLEKFKDAATDQQGQIIGQFGLGFYSAFMVAKEVEIQTLSYKEGSAPARWFCDGSTEFTIEAGNRTERGTDIILHLAEDSEEFLDEFRLRGILEKYFSYIPTTIQINENKVSGTRALWAEAPNNLSDQDYIDFYHTLYPGSPDPLFWIHLNVDYPFNLTGILYFPKVAGQQFDTQREKIKLFSRQVFITDQVKDVVPEWLLLLHGVLDSPDIPLNVSRSYLQADGNVKKINNHITKKVADKLQELFQNKREEFEQKWPDIGLFVKFGMVSDPKFSERSRGYAMVKNNAGKFFTLAEYAEQVKALQTDKDNKQVWLYTADADKQHVYVSAAEKRGYDVLVMDHIIDTHFAQHIEQLARDKAFSEAEISLKRVDADQVDKLIDKGDALPTALTKEQEEKVAELFKAALKNEKLNVKVVSMPSEDFPVSLTQNEFMRRMSEMYAANGMGAFGMGGEFLDVQVNANHPLVAKLAESSSEEESTLGLARQLYDLALLSQQKLSGASLTQFIERSISYLKTEVLA